MKLTKLITAGIAAVMLTGTAFAANLPDGSKDNPLRVLMIPADTGTNDITADYAPVFNGITEHLVPARGGVADRLDLKEGNEVVFLETLRKVEGKPFCVISHFLPHDLFPYVMESYDGGSLHQFLEKHYATQVERSESLISAVIPESDDAALLNMPRNSPVLRVKSINVVVNTRKPVEYVVTRFRGDATQLSVQP
ncbi:MAG: UTRA domain-containing protein [Candidatus Thiodiazotropha sp. LLP2]